MSHEIDMTNNRANMAFVGKTPWHGLGQELTPGAGIEVWKQESGLNFVVEEAKVEYLASKIIFPNGVGVIPTLQFKNRKVLYRNDSGAGLGLVSSRYKAVQPGEILDFFQKLVGSAGFELETAGSLYGGAKVWALAKVGEQASIVPGDDVRPYLLLGTSFDGTMATMAKLTAIRAVCANTFTPAIEEDKHARTVRVQHCSFFDSAAVQEQLGIAIESWGGFVAEMRKMAQEKLDAEQADRFLVNILGGSFDSEDESSLDIRESRSYRQIMDLFDGKGIGAEMAGSTNWGLLNAVTEFVDHSRSKNASARMSSAWFGAGDTLKSKAYQMLSV